MDLSVYLSGEIHTDWRDQIIQESEDLGLPIDFYTPTTDHESSDHVGRDILGPEAENFWSDHKSAKINAIRTKTALEQADVVVIKFGEQYKQWNAAFEAGYAAATGKPYIVIHPENLSHALKEVDAQALAVAESHDQVVKILEYVCRDFV